MARYETKIKEGAAPFLEQGEEVVAAVMARPRGWTQAGASAGGGFLAGVLVAKSVARSSRSRSRPPRTRARAREPDGACGASSAAFCR